MTVPVGILLAKIQLLVVHKIKFTVNISLQLINPYYLGIKFHEQMYHLLVKM